MAKRPGDVIAERVRKYRQQQGWSVRRLAEECARLGAPQLTAASLANIERGQTESAKRKRREVTVDELLVLGYALAVPPLLLAVPLGENADLEITTTATIHPHLAWDVITGRQPLVVTDRRATRLEDWAHAARPVLLFDALRDAQDRYSDSATRIRLAERSGDEETLRQARQRHVAALESFAEAVDAVLAAGLEAPMYPQEWVDDLKASGIVEHPERLAVYEEGEPDGQR